MLQKIFQTVYDHAVFTLGIKNEILRIKIFRNFSQKDAPLLVMCIAPHLLFFILD